MRQPADRIGVPFVGEDGHEALREDVLTVVITLLTPFVIVVLPVGTLDLFLGFLVACHGCGGEVVDAQVVSLV